jgi:hypothetical protein
MWKDGCEGSSKVVLRAKINKGTSAEGSSHLSHYIISGHYRERERKTARCASIIFLLLKSTFVKFALVLCFMPYVPKASTRQDVAMTGSPVAAMPKIKEMLVYHHNALSCPPQKLYVVYPTMLERKPSKEIALQRARKMHRNHQRLRPRAAELEPVKPEPLPPRPPPRPPP